MDESRDSDTEHHDLSTTMKAEPNCWSCFRKQLCLVCSVLITIFGLCAIIGWHTKIPLLIQVHPNFAPMQYNTALCFIGSGVALFFAVTHLRKLSFFAATTVALLSGATLWEWITGRDFYGIDQLFFTSYIETLSPFPGRMAMLTSASFLISALALISPAVTKNHKSTSWITGALSSLVFAISVLGIIGYGIGLTGAFSWNEIAQMSLPTVCGFSALSIGIFSIAWRDSKTAEEDAPEWLPIAIPVIALTATGLLGTAIRNQEHRDISHNVADNTAIITTVLSVELDSRHHSLRRMARRQSQNNEVNMEDWRTDALQYTQDDTGYHFIGWTDENMKIQDLAPDHDRDRIAGFQAIPSGETLESLKAAWQSHDDVITTSLELYPDQLTLLTPIYKNNEFSGTIIAPLNLENFFSSLYPENLLGGYHYEISANGSNVYSKNPTKLPSDSTWIKTFSFEMHGVHWAVTVWPNEQLLNEEHTFYSNIVIGIGVLSAILLGASIYFSQLARQKSNESAARNIRLQEEIAERIRSKNELEKISSLNNAIVMHSAYAVITTTTDGLITSFNPAAEAMLGYSAEEIVNKQSPAIFHDPKEVAKRAKELSKKYDRSIAPGFEVFITDVNNGNSEQREWTFICKDGSRLPVTLGVSVLEDSSGKAIGYLGIAGDISDLKEAEAELKKTHDKLITMSLQVGRAEVATNILHNVGNVLNSVNISSTLLANKVKNSRINTVARLSELLDEHKNNLTQFIETDRRGQELPSFVSKLSGKLAEEQKDLLEEISKLDSNIEHIKEIVAMQQNHSKISDIKERVRAAELIDNALRVNSAVLKRDQFTVNVNCDEDLHVFLVKHKVIQVLVNLISNSKHACQHAKIDNPTININAEMDSAMLIIKVSDNGEGILNENITRIFSHGFTTKKDGHGFGLHSSALAAKEMGGALEADSKGAGMGATFTLSIPTEPPSNS